MSAAIDCDEMDQSIRLKSERKQQERFDCIIEIYEGALQKAQRLGHEFEKESLENRLMWLRMARKSGKIEKVATWLAEADANKDADKSDALRVALVAIVNPKNRADTADMSAGGAQAMSGHLTGSLNGGTL